MIEVGISTWAIVSFAEGATPRCTNKKPLLRSSSLESKLTRSLLLTSLSLIFLSIKYHLSDISSFFSFTEEKVS